MTQAEFSPTSRPRRKRSPNKPKIVKDPFLVAYEAAINLLEEKKKEKEQIKEKLELLDIQIPTLENTARALRDMTDPPAEE